MKKFAITLLHFRRIRESLQVLLLIFKLEDMPTVPQIKAEGYSTEMSKVTDLVR